MFFPLLSFTGYFYVNILIMPDISEETQIIVFYLLIVVTFKVDENMSVVWNLPLRFSHFFILYND